MHFLSRLSEVIGAGVENPEDLTPLRRFLSSREMILILDNAESILDPHGPDAQKISDIVEELSHFDTVCLFITSRISTIPQHCRRLHIPTLSPESACDIFYGIYNHGGRSDSIGGLLRRLDFHALSITLLATTASRNMWDHDRVAQELDARHVQEPRTDYHESLAAMIDLSLASPTFRELGPDARDLLAFIAFFPKGINENNLKWLLPTISDARPIIDKFCTLSLIHRSDTCIRMLGPLREHLRPKDPLSNPLLRATKECYFTRLSVHVGPNEPGFEEARWITSEDANVEHLLDVFTSIDAGSADVWDACAYFMKHLFWHKRRLVMLGPKIEALPNDHPSKPECLFQLSRLFESVGNREERKRLLTSTLRLWRERGDESKVAQTLGLLSDANRLLGLHEEGTQQLKESLKIYERLDSKSGQGLSWHQLASFLYRDGKLDEAEQATFRAIDLLSDKGNQFQVCQCHRTLGLIYSSKQETEKAINHFETALGIASSSNWHNEQFSIHYNMADVLFLNINRFSDAHAHVGQAKSHVQNDKYLLGRATQLQARIWYKDGKFREAKFEASHAADVFEKLGTTKELERCRKLIRKIEKKTRKPSSSSEFFEAVLFLHPLNAKLCPQLGRRLERTPPRAPDPLFRHIDQIFIPDGS